MINSFVKKPATTIAFILFFVVLGFVSYFNLGIEETPKIDFPIVTVKVVYSGANPVEVESQVVKKIEEVVNEISDIKNIQSRCYDNYGFIFIEFNLGVKIDNKAIEVKDKVEAILNDLPKEIEKPIIQKFDVFAKPIMQLILNSDKFDTKYLYEFADKKLKQKFSSISGISSIDIIGGKEREIQVKLDPILMKKYYISIPDVIAGLAEKNLNIPGGSIDSDKSSINVRFIGEFDSFEINRKYKHIFER